MNPVLFSMVYKLALNINIEKGINKTWPLYFVSWLSSGASWKTVSLSATCLINYGGNRWIGLQTTAWQKQWEEKNRYLCGFHRVYQYTRKSTNHLRKRSTDNLPKKSTNNLPKKIYEIRQYATLTRIKKEKESTLFMFIALAL